MALAFVSAACATPTLTERREAAAPALSALQRGGFQQAGEDARAKLASDGKNPYARLVRAIVTYEASMRALSLDVRTLVIGGAAAGGSNDAYLRTSLEKAESALARVEDDSAVVRTATPTSRWSCAWPAGTSTGTATAWTRATTCCSRLSRTRRASRSRRGPVAPADVSLRSR